MRQISFAFTTPQILARMKTVTRRLGWKTLRPGTLLQAVEKAQGLGKGGKVKKLCVIRVVDVRREELMQITLDPTYGERECAREGFPELEPHEFERMFCTHMRCKPERVVTRIEFDYSPEVAKP